MVVVFKGAGNHSNCLFQTVHFEAFCRENGYRFYNPSFSNMSKYYGVKSLFFDKMLTNVLCALYVCKLLPAINCNRFEDYTLYHEAISKRKLAFVKSWCFRNHDLTKKYRDFFSTKVFFARRVLS